MGAWWRVMKAEEKWALETETQRLLCLVVSDAGVGSGVESFSNSVENFK